MIKVFIGQDDAENVAYHVLCNSIIRQCSEPVSITPIKLSHLKELYKRPVDEKASNEFSMSRFLVPYLCNYEGKAIFMDCDMLLLGDIAELWNLQDDQYAVQVVKHDYTPRNTVKFLRKVQYSYPKKNWSSVMLFNNEKCKSLTPDYINTAEPKDLHRFEWTDSVGMLPVEWNHLVGEYKPNENVKNVHFTVGGPYFAEYRFCDYSTEWFAEHELMNRCLQLSDLG